MGWQTPFLASHHIVQQAQQAGTKANQHGSSKEHGDLFFRLQGNHETPIIWLVDIGGFNPENLGGLETKQHLNPV